MDNNKAAALVSLAIIGGGIWWWLRQQRAATADVAMPDGAISVDAFGGFSFDPVVYAATDAVTQVADAVQNIIAPGSWSPPASAAPYLDQIYRVEAQYGMPRNLLARQLYQESRYRPDIINGGPNSAGAIGIAQIIPRWNPGVDPRDPVASIDFAGKKMAGLFRVYGDWKLALAAYNWGEGNLAKVNNVIASTPAETRNYVAEISTAVGIA